MSAPKRPDQDLSGKDSPGKRRAAPNKPAKGRKVRVPRNALLVRFLLHPVGKTLMVLALLTLVVGTGVFIYYYQKYAKVIDARLKGGPYMKTSRIYAAPAQIAVGDSMTPAEIATSLRHSGYSENSKNTVGYYVLKSDSIDIFPGVESYFLQEPAAIRFAKNQISRITSLRDNTARPMYELEPQVITNLHDRSREKQRVVHYEDIPLVLRNAILSAEDKRFFSHPGFDLIGILRSAWVDLRHGHNQQGASTLSMQLSRYMFLNLSRTWQRKAAEVMITIQLEQKLSKEQIFELYCNQVDMGQRGSFMIRGFGEAAQVYFGKDLKSLTVAEAATLAGILPSASLYNPYRHPERARERRNIVLSLMRQNGFITDREYAVANESPMKALNQAAESSDAPYFVDLVNDELEKRLPGTDFQGHADKIYTTIDPDLQRAANEAVTLAMREVDAQVRKQKRFKGVPFVEPQAALIALDPHTGEIRALVGGRNYGISQLNHVLAQRQPGSIFKPFVYAAAMNTAIDGSTNIFTPASVVMDEPTTWHMDNQPDYSPNNFERTFEGPMTFRYALAHSINIPAIKVAEMVGYDKVVELAHAAGISEEVKATPAMAIGSYVATPIEMAGAYTVFANKGVHVQPSFLTAVKGPAGATLYEQKPELKKVLDPRVNYVMVNMLEEVLRSGTGASVHRLGFNEPAAGKTGTSHDGWFAGFTTELLCIVWVGFDDNRELNVEGAKSALPIWTEFMKRALTLRRYSNAQPFAPPAGITSAVIDKETGLNATSACPNRINEVFIAGTEPVGLCQLHKGTPIQQITSWSEGDPENAGVGGSQALARRRGPVKDVPSAENPQSAKNPPKEPEKKKGLFGKLMGIFH